MKISEIKSLWDQADSDGEKAKSYAETEEALRWQVAEAINNKLKEKDENGKRVISQRDLAKELGRTQPYISYYNAVWEQFGSDNSVITFTAAMAKVREPKVAPKPVEVPAPPVNEVRPAPQNDPQPSEPRTQREMTPTEIAAHQAEMDQLLGPIHQAMRAFAQGDTLIGMACLFEDLQECTKLVNKFIEICHETEPGDRHKLVEPGTFEDIEAEMAGLAQALIDARSLLNGGTPETISIPDDPSSLFEN